MGDSILYLRVHIYRVLNRSLFRVDISKSQVSCSFSARGLLVSNRLLVTCDKHAPSVNNGRMVFSYELQMFLESIKLRTGCVFRGEI